MTRIFILLFLLLVAFPFAVFAQARFDRQDLVSNTQQTALAESLPVRNGAEFRMVPFNPLDLQNPRDWKSQFENVVVINKADRGPTHQTLRLYVQGELKLVTKTSTGREQFEKGGPRSEISKVHQPTRDYFSTTPTGYYTPQTLDIRHKSELWGSIMPYAVFFSGGIAVHQAPVGTEGKLGTRASGGCVRISEQAAQVVFKTIQASGSDLVPKFSRDGKPFRRWNGDFERELAYRTLVIVEERVD